MLSERSENFYGMKLCETNDVISIDNIHKRKGPKSWNVINVRHCGDTLSFSGQDQTLCCTAQGGLYYHRTSY